MVLLYSLAMFVHTEQWKGQCAIAYLYISYAT